MRLTIIGRSSLVARTPWSLAAYFLGSRAGIDRDLLIVQGSRGQTEYLATALGCGLLQSILPRWPLQFFGSFAQGPH
jgi:hypothetical protein